MVVEGGSPEALRRAAEELERLAADPQTPDRSRPYILYDAGVALAQLLESDADAAERALACETRAAQMLKDQLIAGDAAAAAGWVDSLCALTLVSARAVGRLGPTPLSSAWLEVDVARDLLGGTPHWPRIGIAYSNLGAGLLRIYMAEATAARDPGTRDRAVRAFDAAIEMLGAAATTEFTDEQLVARINRCTCMSFAVTREDALIRLAERCLETYEWLISTGRVDDVVAGSEIGAGCAVLHAMQQALAGFLDRGAGERRLAIARTVGARLLLLACPELWLPMEGPFADPCRVDERDVTPTELILSIEVAHLQAALSGADEARAGSTILATWPAPLPSGVVSAMQRLGRDEPWLGQLVISLCGRIERARAGELQPSEQLAERYGEFVAWSCIREVAPIEQAKSLREAFLADPDAAPDERLHHVALIAEAVGNSAWRWGEVEVDELRKLICAWAAEDAEDRERGLRWSRAKLRLLGRLAQLRPAECGRLRREARAARAELEAGPLDAAGLGLYEDAVVGEAFALREMTHKEGGRALSAAAAALSREIGEDLARWGVGPEIARPLLALVSEEVDVTRGSLEEAVLAFRRALAGDPHATYPRAWRLLGRIAESGRELDEEAVAAARDAIRLVLDEAPSRPVPAELPTLFVGLANHPQLRLNMRDGLTLLDLGLRLAQEDDTTELNQLLRLPLIVERYERSAQDRLQRVRASERIARLVFASGQNLEQVDPSVCAAFLTQQALDADPARGATFLDRRSRITVAIAALIAACAGGKAAHKAASLWAVADHTRPYGAELAAALYAGLGEYVGSLPASELPDALRQVIEADIAMFGGGPGSDEGAERSRQLGPQATFIWRASHFYAVREDGDFDDAELWQEIDEFIADVQASGEADEDRAAWILGAAHAALMLSRRGRETDAAAARRLAEAALAAARSPRVPQTALGLPLLELAILLGVLVSDEGLARSALAGYRAAVNQRILMSPDFAAALDGVQTLGAIEDATTVALKRNLGIALEIAESGRAKLLTAMAAGLLPSLGDLDGDGTPALDAFEGFEGFIGRLFDQADADPFGAAAELLRKTSWADAVAALVIPWKSLSHVEELDRLSDGGGPQAAQELRRVALADPDVGELLDLSAEGRVLTWALGDLDDPHVAMLLADGTLLRGDGDVEQLRADNDHRLPDRAQTVVIDCGSDPRIAIDVANGIALAAPDGRIPPIVSSARLLRVNGPLERPEPIREATIFANPTGDLPGSLLEAAAWSAREDIAPRLLMQEKATVEAFLAALRDSRLVVLSAHGRADRRSGAALRLADGEVSVKHLLELAGTIAAERVILSCCWGGARSTWISRREALGVVSCLLALGVDEVIAPVEAVSDLATGIFAAGLARTYRPAAGAEETLRQARIDLTRIPRDSRVAEGLEWIRVGVGSGAVVAADAAQVEEAELGLRQTDAAEVADIGDGFGVFGTGRPKER